MILVSFHTLSGFLSMIPKSTTVYVSFTTVVEGSKKVSYSVFTYFHQNKQFELNIRDILGDSSDTDLVLSEEQKKVIRFVTLRSILENKVNAKIVPARVGTSVEASIDFPELEEAVEKRYQESLEKASSDKPQLHNEAIPGADVEDISLPDSIVSEPIQQPEDCEPGTDQPC